METGCSSSSYTSVARQWANPLQQGGEGGVGGGVFTEDEARSVPAGLDLGALAGPAASLGQSLPEPFRAGRAELHRQQALHREHPNQPGLV